MSGPTPPVTVRDCLRDVIRRSGGMVPPAADAIAAPLTDDELAELIFGLQLIRIARHKAGAA